MAEKNANEIPRDLRALFTKGNDALLRDNFDYAISLFEQVLLREPTFFECRKALRTAQTGKSGGKGGFFKKAWSSASSSPQILKAQTALKTNDPVGALAIAEQVLNSDPTSSPAHRVVLEAANAMEMPNTAVMSLDILTRNSPKDKTLAIDFATRLADTGEVKKAEYVLKEMLRNLPNDADLNQALKDISARRTLSEGGYEKVTEGSSYRDLLRDQKQAASLEQENRVQRSEDVAEKLIAEYEARLKTEPNNLKLARSLAELYTQKKQFDRALEYYQRVKASDMGNDPSLDRAIAETQTRKLDYDIEQLDPAAADYPERSALLKGEKLTFQIVECQRRVEKFPTDFAIRFEMGALYFQAGKIGEAIQEFQKAQQNPNKRIAAMGYLAQCYAKRKMNDLAAKTLQNAIKEKPVFDEEKKELIYNLGSVLEAMGKKEDAIEQFKLIYEVDISYKDVAKKVDDYYAGQ